MIGSRVARALTVAALAVSAQCGTPSAWAVAPPPVDEKYLPAAALPSPPGATVQRESCAAVMPARTEPGGGNMPSRQGDVDLPQVWQLTRGAGQRVAIIDTGVRRHPRLADLVAGGDYVSTGDGTQDCDAHGTLVAGIIAATADAKADRFAGVAPDVTLISIRQSSSKYTPARDRSGNGVGDVQTLARAVRTAADLGATVINVSSVACVRAGDALDDRALGAALAYAVDVKNAVVVAAAGNTAGTSQCPAQRPGATADTVTVVVSPAWYDDYVLTVGSVDRNGAPSAFTLAGPWVDVAAVGENVTSLNPTGDGIVSSVAAQHGSQTSQPLFGTSYAAPIVSGLAALIRARFPALTARQVMQRIRSTAHHPPAGWDPLVGNGTVDILAAVSTDAPLPGPVPPVPKPERAPISAPAATSSAPRTSEATTSRARHTAFGGTAICLIALVGAGTSALFGAKRRLLRERVARD